MARVRLSDTARCAAERVVSRRGHPGTVYERGTPEFEKFFEPSLEEDALGFPTPELLPGARAVIWIDITRVGTACGYAVPFMKFESHRERASQGPAPSCARMLNASPAGDQLNKEAARMEARDAETEDPWTLPWQKGLMSYWVQINTWSVDGLPGLKQCMNRITPEGIRESAAEHGIKFEKPKAGGKLQDVSMVLLGLVLGMLLMSVLQGGNLQLPTLRLPL